MIELDLIWGTLTRCFFPSHSPNFYSFYAFMMMRMWAHSSFLSFILDCFIDPAFHKARTHISLSLLKKEIDCIFNTVRKIHQQLTAKTQCGWWRCKKHLSSHCLHFLHIFNARCWHKVRFYWLRFYLKLTQK